MENFYTALTHSFSLSEEECKEIEGVSAKYPYFQVAQILRLQNTFGEEKYERLLYKLGIHIPDARHYYQNLMLHKMYPQPKQEVAEIPQKKAVDLENSDKENTTEKVVTPKNAITEIVERESKDSVEELHYAPSFYQIEEKEKLPKAEGKMHNFNDWFTVLDAPKNTQNAEKTAKTISSFMKKDKKSKVEVREQRVETEVPQTKEHLMSQTLAEIYVKQHLYDRALAIYEKLDLNNSEKNTTFARRIKEINELKKN